MVERVPRECGNDDLAQWRIPATCSLPRTSGMCSSMAVFLESIGSVDQKRTFAVSMAERGVDGV
jgi:hypothetical protein